MSGRKASVKMPLDKLYRKCVHPKPKFPRSYGGNRNFRRQVPRFKSYQDLDYTRDVEVVDINLLSARRNWGQLKNQCEQIPHARPNEFLAAGNNQQYLDPKSNREHQDLNMSMGASASNQPQQLYSAPSMLGGMNSPVAYVNPQENWVRNPVLKHGKFNYNGWPNQQPANNQPQLGGIYNGSGTGSNQPQHGGIYNGNGVGQLVFRQQLPPVGNEGDCRFSDIGNIPQDVDLQRNPEQQQLHMHGNMMSAAASNQFQPLGNDYGMHGGMNPQVTYVYPQSNRFEGHSRSYWVGNPFANNGGFNNNVWPNQQPANNQAQLGGIYNGSGTGNNQPQLGGIYNGNGVGQLVFRKQPPPLHMNGNIMSAATSNQFQPLGNYYGMNGGMNPQLTYVYPQMNRFECDCRGNWVGNPFANNGDFNYNGWPNQHPANNLLQPGGIYNGRRTGLLVLFQQSSSLVGNNQQNAQHNPEQLHMTNNNVYNPMGTATFNYRQQQAIFQQPGAIPQFAWNPVHQPQASIQRVPSPNPFCIQNDQWGGQPIFQQPGTQFGGSVCVDNAMDGDPNSVIWTPVKSEESEEPEELEEPEFNNLSSVEEQNRNAGNENATNWIRSGQLKSMLKGTNKPEAPMEDGNSSQLTVNNTLQINNNSLPKETNEMAKTAAQSDDIPSGAVRRHTPSCQLRLADFLNIDLSDSESSDIGERFG